MTFWTYRHRFTVSGTAVEIATRAGMRATTTHLLIDGVRVGTECAPVATDGLRVMEVEGRLPDGRTVRPRAVARAPARSAA